MSIRTGLIAALLVFGPILTYPQATHTSVPLAEFANRAITLTNITGDEAIPFHLRITVTEPENPQSPYQGVIEEWWASKDQWRREVTSKDGLHQIIVVANGDRTEKDEGEYYPLWLRNFVLATFDPAPNLKALLAGGATVDQTSYSNGLTTQQCARLKSPVGEGERASDTYSLICFYPGPRLNSVTSNRYHMSFEDYRSFGKYEFPYKLIEHPESGTELVGKVELEDLPASARHGALFNPLATRDDHFETAIIPTRQLEAVVSSVEPTHWPPVHGGNTHGHLAIYISADSQGKVREAWPINGDNGELDDVLRPKARTWQLKPVLDANGNPTQFEGSLSFAFTTQLDRPAPRPSKP